MLTHANYCTDCNEDLTLHASGAVACSCTVLDAADDAIPEAWKLTADELQDARRENEEYCS